MSLPEDRGHGRIQCRVCGFAGWSEDTGGCPRCPVPAPKPIGTCDGCGTRGRLFLVDISRDGDEEWLCRDCRADWQSALGMF